MRAASRTPCKFTSTRLSQPARSPTSFPRLIKIKPTRHSERSLRSEELCAVGRFLSDESLFLVIVASASPPQHLRSWNCALSAPPPPSMIARSYLDQTRQPETQSSP